MRCKCAHYATCARTQGMLPRVCRDESGRKESKITRTRHVNKFSIFQGSMDGASMLLLEMLNLFTYQYDNIRNYKRNSMFLDISHTYTNEIAAFKHMIRPSYK